MWDYVFERNFQVHELTQLITRAQGGDTDAYDEVVRQFQDRAVAYAYFLLGDFHLAQDAAQEAFCEAFMCLSTLQEPLAFPGWLRRIIFKQCDRICRKKQVTTVGIEAALGEISPHGSPHQAAEKREVAWQVRQAIATLTPAQRSVVLLFYLGGHSQNQIAEWLDVPVTTVKRRLYTARHKLKEKMIEMIREDLQERRPSRTSEFAGRVRVFTSQFSRSIDEGQSIVGTLALLAQREQSSELRQVIAQIQQDITGDGHAGATLSEALSKHPDLFTASYIGAIKQGEVNGDLALVLRQLSSD